MLPSLRSLPRIKLTPQPVLNGSVRHLQVTVVGASGCVGQPLSLLLKQNSLISTLALHDIANAVGVAADLSHIDTPTTVKAFNGANQLESALRGADIVVVPAGTTRKPGMTRDQLLDANAEVAAKVALAVSVACPGALLAFITNPINSIVPIVAEFLKSKEVYDPRRLFGVTTLDVLRAKTFISAAMELKPQELTIPVIGGHADITILPLFSQCKPCFNGDEQTRTDLTLCIQQAGTQVVEAKQGKGSATLSIAHAAAYFVNSLLRAITGEKAVVECAYVESENTDAQFFSSPLLLGLQGIKTNLGLPKLDNVERKALKALLPILKKNIEEGQKYARKEIG